MGTGTEMGAAPQRRWSVRPGSPRLGAFKRLSIAALGLLLLSGCSTGKPGTTHRPYTVYAESALGFAQSVRANAPRSGRAFGLVEITFHPVYTLVPSDKGCSAKVEDVGLELVVVLPKWRDGKAVPASVKRKWDRFGRTIRAHEMTHIRIAEDYAARMRKTIGSLRSSKSCADLRSKIRTRIARLKAQHLRAHARFDAAEKKRLKALL